MKSNQRLSDKWQKHVLAFAESGLTRRDYCRQNGIAIYQLDYWRRKFQRSHSKHPASAGAWIPLEIRDSGSAAENAGICLRIGRVTIDVKPGYDRKLLTDVLQVLESVC
jgi:transposase-like protein